MAITFKDNNAPPPKRKPAEPHSSVYVPNMPQDGYQVPYPEQAKQPKPAREKTARKPVTKERISLNLDPDVLEHFRSMGPGWQIEMQRVLRTHMEEKR